MTPDTTPAPMTHEEARYALDEAQMTASNHGQIERIDALRAYIEAERTAREAAERERDAWMTEAKLLEHKTITCGVAATHPDADLTTRYPAEWDSPQHQAVRALRAKCAELEAVVGRCEALAAGWDLHKVELLGQKQFALAGAISSAAADLRTALRGQRSDTGRGA